MQGDLLWTGVFIKTFGVFIRTFAWIMLIKILQLDKKTCIKTSV
jgi:hypothetical protein